MRNRHTKVSDELTKDVSINKAYGSIALSTYVKPTVRELRKTSFKIQNKKFFNFKTRKNPIMRKYVTQFQQTDFMKPQELRQSNSMRQYSTLNNFNADNWATEPIQLQKVSYYENTKQKPNQKSTFYLHKEAKGYRNVQKNIATNKEWKTYITASTRVLKRNRSSLKALKNKPTRLEREVFGVDINGKPLQRQMPKLESSVNINKDITQRFFEMKLKYENMSYLKFDHRKPLIKKIEPNIENRFSKEIFTPKQQNEMKHEGVFHLEKKSKDQEGKDHARQIFNDSKKDDLVHHQMVKACMRFLREIWGQNPNKTLYNNLFQDIMKILHKAVYHQGYISPDFPLSFEDQLDMKQIPNYLIVNELLEQLTQKQQRIKHLLDSIQVLQGQTAFMQREVTMQKQMKLETQQKCDNVSIQCMDATTQLAIKDHTLLDKLKEIDRLKLDIDNFKQLCYDHDKEKKQLLEQMSDLDKEFQCKLDDQVYKFNELKKEFLAQKVEIHDYKNEVADLKFQLQKAENETLKKALNEEHSPSAGLPRKQKQKIDRLYRKGMKELENMFQKLSIKFNFEKSTLPRAIKKLAQYLEVPLGISFGDDA